MKRLLTISAAALSVLALSGAALADNGGGSNGSNGTPPGQTGSTGTPPGQTGSPGNGNPNPSQGNPNPGQGNPNPSQGNPNPSQGNPNPSQGTPAQPAGNPAQPAAADKGKSEEAKAEHKKPKPAKPASKGKSEAAKAASHGKSEAAKSASHGKSAEAQHKVIICHATGSASNPYVVLNISVRGWLNGHKAKHPDDKLLKDPASPGEKGPDKSVCGQPAGGSSVQQSTQASSTGTTAAACPATGTRTEQVLVGIEHATGSKTNPFVRISPSEASAHLDKHEDDRAVYETRTIVVATGETCSTAATGAAATTTGAATTTTGAATTAAIGAALAGTGTTVAAAIAGMGAEPTLLKEAGVPNADAPLGGVAGVNATIVNKKPKAKGGALGATAQRGTLPFTGLQLLVAALIGAGLLGTGLAVRARSRA